MMFIYLNNLSVLVFIIAFTACNTGDDATSCEENPLRPDCKPNLTGAKMIGALIFLLGLPFVAPAQGQAPLPSFSLEDTTTFKPVSDAVAGAIMESNARSELLSVKECRFVGAPVPDSPAHEQLVFVTTADGCAGDPSHGPMWLVREKFDDEASVVLSHSGNALNFLPDNVESHYPNVEVLSGTWGWQVQTVWHFNGDHYVLVSERQEEIRNR